MVASPIPQSYSATPNQSVVTSSYSQSITGFPQDVTQVDIARAAVEASEAIAPANPLIESSVEKNAGEATKLQSERHRSND